MSARTDDATNTIEAEVSRLEAVHKELKARLSDLNGRLYLSPDEQVERKRLQKLKLATKDQIARLRAT